MFEIHKMCYITISKSLYCHKFYGRPICKVTDNCIINLLMYWNILTQYII